MEQKYEDTRKKAIRLLNSEIKKYGFEFICMAYIKWINLFKIKPEELNSP